MMMDIGMFGHGHHNQHNSAYSSNEANYYNYSAELCSPNHGNTHQVQPAAGYPSSTYHYEEAAYGYDSSEAPSSPQDLNYYHPHHQNIPQDNPIINTETGLSYTNLDYSNSNGGIYPTINHHQNMYVADSFQRTHPDISLRHPGEEMPDQIHGNYHHNTKYLPHQLETAGDGYHPHLVPGNAAASSCMEYQHLRYKDEGMQGTEGGLNRIRPHHVIHGLNSVQQQQPALPTYKWMQVKRNVPKPAGKSL